MAMNVSVPFPLLEDIFRLLEYLVSLGEHDNLHFQKAGYSQHFEHDNALWELKLKLRRLQPQIVETYLLTVDGATEDERRKLKEWVADGNGVYDNPYSLFDEYGNPMDFINGCRIGDEMAEASFCTFFGDMEAVNDFNLNEDVPF